ncbi:YceI family protein [Phenylobacterium sp.]|jgi:polyisoprenoid-binding protein YceI|uniref:YceI family protein n=1 Tax=Phenylobacterium sp. TaxID=1871053 RepID=UPI003784913A
MRTPIIAAACWALATAGALAAPVSADPAQTPAGRYILDAQHASLVMKVSHMGFSRYTMRFNQISGGFDYDPANWRATVVRVEIDAASVDTGSASFNRQVAQMLDADKHPKILFVSRGFEEVEGLSAKLVGDLTFHGVTKPVSLDVTFNGAGPGMMGGGTRLGFSASGRIKRSDFGVTEYSQWVGDDVALLIETEFYRR